MHNDLSLLDPIARQQSDTMVLDALTRYVAQSGTRVGEKLPPERDLRFIEQKLDVMEKVHMDVGSAGAEDWEFHAAIYHAARNPLLLQMVAGIYDLLHAFFESPPEQARFSDSFPLHRTLFEAIARREPETARRLNNEILNITEHDMKEVINAAR